MLVWEMIKCMEQCYSAYKGLTPDGGNVDYASDWKNAAVYFTDTRA